MSNRDKLKQLVIDVFLLTEEEFSFDLKKVDTETWDSLGVVSIAVGVQEVFGYHFSQDEAMSVGSVQDIMNILSNNGISFED